MSIDVTVQVPHEGARLRMLRTAAGIPAYIVAGRAHIHPTRLTKIEKGRERNTSPEVFERIEEAIRRGNGTGP